MKENEEYRKAIEDNRNLASQQNQAVSTEAAKEKLRKLKEQSDAILNEKVIV
jgi:hypothetical protein